LLTLRAEAAARDVKADSNDVVRLDNVARRARADFERVCGIDSTKRQKQRSMAAIERELSHAR